MDSLGGLTDFFYNLIPGTLFIFALDELGVKMVKESPEKLFLVSIMGFFLGFLGQALAKEIKKCLNLNKKIMGGIIDKENSDNKKIYRTCLKKLRLFSKVEFNEKNTVDNFFAMDNFLRNSGSPYIINHFAQRAAFWANISLGSILIIFISFFTVECGHPLIIFASLMLSAISGLFSYDCSKAEYESVLQAFALKNETKRH